MPPHLISLLKSTSRSFYLSLRVLPKILRSPISMGYLLCRTADSIADTDMLPASHRQKALDDFKKIFEPFPLSYEKVESFQKTIRELMKEDQTDEGKLMKGFPLMMKTLQSWHRTDQALVQKVVLGVINGMMMDLRSFGNARDSLKAFQKNEDLETYLGWIGGEPGRFWTELTIHYFPKYHSPDRSKWIEKGVDFGKGLQMINILRDLPEDLNRGRCYIPESVLGENQLKPSDLLDQTKVDRFLPLYHQLIDQTIHRLKNGLSYLYSIPRTAFRLRAAIWWPLSIGLKTLGKMRENSDVLNPEKRVRISRNDVYGLVGISPFILPSNHLLRWDFEDLVGAASSSMSPHQKI